MCPFTSSCASDLDRLGGIWKFYKFSPASSPERNAPPGIDSRAIKKGNERGASSQIFCLGIRGWGRDIRSGRRWCVNRYFRGGDGVDGAVSASEFTAPRSTGSHPVALGGAPLLLVGRGDRPGRYGIRGRCKGWVGVF